MADPISDGTVDFTGGQDASKVAGRIAQNAYAAGVNITVKKGVPAPRWGFRYCKLTFPEGTVAIPGGKTRTYEDLFYSGKYQSLIPYSIGQDFYILIIISGVPYLVNQQTLNVQVLNLPANEPKLSPLRPRTNASAAGRYLAVFDYPAYPVIIEANSARRADPTKDEILISTNGTYNQNRLFIANNGNEFTGGDPAGSKLTPNAPITFTEVLAPSSPYVDQFFQLSTNYNNDPITAMTFLQATDTSTGIGPMLVSTANAIYSYQTQNPRAQWEASRFGSNFVFSSGIAGPAAFVNVGSDVFYIANDGQINSLSMSRDEQKRWSKVPISREVENWLKYNDKSLTKFGAMTYFKNKIIATCNPYVADAVSLDGFPAVDYAHAGMVVLELDNISTLGQTSAPAWAGLWTGINPMGFAVNDDRCFVMSKDGSANALYEIDPSITYDVVPEGMRYVKSIIYTREYDFKDSFQNKELSSIDFGLNEVQGDFELNVSYKPSQASNYTHWNTFKHNAPWRTCSAPTDCQIPGFAAHNFKEVNLGSPDKNTCSPVTNELYSQFRRLQVKLEITGKYWEIDGMKLNAIPKMYAPRITSCEEKEPVEVTACCNTDWKIPEINKCQPTKT